MGRPEEQGHSPQDLQPMASATRCLQVGLSGDPQGFERQGDVGGLRSMEEPLALRLERPKQPELFQGPESLLNPGPTPTPSCREVPLGELLRTPSAPIEPEVQIDPRAEPLEVVLLEKPHGET